MNSGVLAKIFADELVTNPPRLSNMKLKDVFGFAKVEATEIKTVGLKLRFGIGFTWQDLHKRGT